MLLLRLRGGGDGWRWMQSRLVRHPHKGNGRGGLVLAPPGTCDSRNVFVVHFDTVSNASPPRRGNTKCTSTLPTRSRQAATNLFALATTSQDSRLMTQMDARFARDTRMVDVVVPLNC